MSTSQRGKEKENNTWLVGSKGSSASSLFVVGSYQNKREIERDREIERKKERERKRERERESERERERNLTLASTLN